MQSQHDSIEKEQLIQGWKVDREKLEDLYKSNAGLRERVKELEENQNKYGEIEIPRPKEEIEERLKAIPKPALIGIIEYLKLDNYEIVKNLAKVTNKDNASEIIAYRDGAISRNDALIETLQKYAKKGTYIDAMKGKEVQK